LGHLSFTKGLVYCRTIWYSGGAEKGKVEMIKITEDNITDIVRVYASRLLEDMDFDTLYSFAYSMLVENKENMSIGDLQKEIKEYDPDILED